MIQTIQNRELPPDIGLVIFDECHSSIYYQIAWDIMMHYSGGIFPWILENALSESVNRPPN